MPSRSATTSSICAQHRPVATGIHYDYPFFGQASDKVVTAWVPIGDVPTSEGPLVVVEGSNRFDDLIAAVRTLDIAGRPENKAAYDSSAVALAQGRGTRLLTADFHAGDVVLFGMYTAHGSLDNHSPVRRVRLSLDIR
jgi:ectoine hydroxylase-related dioxygenase (phytanoyl-CoA dioxygenase family)